MRIADLLTVFHSGRKLARDEVARLERRVRKLREEEDAISAVLTHCYRASDDDSGRIPRLNDRVVQLIEASPGSLREGQEVDHGA